MLAGLMTLQAEATTLNLLQTIQSSMQSELSRLKPAPAEHIHVKSKSECLPTTQDKIQESILNHLKDTKNRFVWLRGSPGSGKTAIAMSVASTLEAQGTLAASFFWDKNQTGSGLDSTKRFPSTLAHQLASFDEDFKMSLVRRLRQRDLQLVQDLPLDKQMKALVIEPMRNLRAILPSETDRLVIVLDGLDECGDLEALECLMGLVLILEELPATFAVFVSCRPESPVVSAWDEARNQGLVIPCKDVDIITKEEKYHTIRCMVEHGLRDRIKKSRWKPSEEDLHAFTLACRELPVMASIRIRDVMWWTGHGRTLQREFQDLLNLADAPIDLNREYLRILRRAYVRSSSAVPLDVAKMYRLLVGTIIAAHRSLSVYSMSQLLGIAEDEAQATLEPISSIIELPSDDMAGVKFYHATAKEFITGDPIGNENDKIFFINDKKGYFLGLLLLRIFNNCCKRNEFRIPTNPPLSDKEKWADFKSFSHQPDYIQYIRYVLYHLDPAKLFSQESNDNELQNEFNSFLTRNFLTFMHVGGYPGAPPGFYEFNVSLSRFILHLFDTTFDRIMM
ncbi:uncharacterized protein EI90DRAFT_2213321 [Cantharellus anzutake]|uniref:uncharacterized protein n=1 Tax=Cantharellus anzutake TaxID=1750568 RepID=UPI001906ECD6|nr:uncharacterized protein EI90DRAFT_2213321 [Cantharellus anzutake]KAF8324841.1 hypothetical protein EI90DRAFT_2213321 [Cantharellus anzutake]